MEIKISCDKIIDACEKKIESLKIKLENEKKQEGAFYDKISENNKSLRAEYLEKDDMHRAYVHCPVFISCNYDIDIENVESIKQMAIAAIKYDNDQVLINMDEFNLIKEFLI